MAYKARPCAVFPPTSDASGPVDPIIDPMSIEHEHRKCSDGGKTLLALNVGNGWEWMGMGVAGIIIDSEPADHSLIPY